LTYTFCNDGIIYKYTYLKGYAASDDTWEPLVNVDNNACYLKYAKAKGLLKK